MKLFSEKRRPSRGQDTKELPRLTPEAIAKAEQSAREARERVASGRGGAHAASGRGGAHAAPSHAHTASHAAPRAAAAQTAGGVSAAPRRGKGGRKALLIVVIVLAVLCLACAGLGLWAGGGETILPGVRAGGIELGGLTPGEAIEKLDAAGWDSGEDAAVQVSLPAGVSFSVTAREAGVQLDAADVVVKAYAYGHDGGAFKNGFAYLRCLLAGRELSLYDADALDREIGRAHV